MKTAAAAAATLLPLLAAAWDANGSSFEIRPQFEVQRVILTHTKRLSPTDLITLDAMAKHMPQNPIVYHVLVPNDGDCWQDEMAALREQLRFFRDRGAPVTLKIEADMSEWIANSPLAGSGLEHKHLAGVCENPSGEFMGFAHASDVSRQLITYHLGGIYRDTNLAPLANFATIFQRYGSRLAAPDKDSGPLSLLRRVWLNNSFFTIMPRDPWHAEIFDSLLHRFAARKDLEEVFPYRSPFPNNLRRVRWSYPGPPSISEATAALQKHQGVSVISVSPLIGVPGTSTENLWPFSGATAEARAEAFERLKTVDRSVYDGDADIEDTMWFNEIHPDDCDVLEEQLDRSLSGGDNLTEGGDNLTEGGDGGGGDGDGSSGGGDGLSDGSSESSDSWLGARADWRPQCYEAWGVLVRRRHHIVILPSRSIMPMQWHHGKSPYRSRVRWDPEGTWRRIENAVGFHWFKADKQNFYTDLLAGEPATLHLHQKACLHLCDTQVLGRLAAKVD